MSSYSANPIYRGSFSEYEITFSTGGLFSGDRVNIIDSVSDRDGSDKLSTVEFAVFSDRTVDLRPGLDIAFVIDTTGSMSTNIGSVKANAQNIINTIFDNALNSRIAVVGYNDPGTNTFISFTDQPTVDERKDAAINAINSIGVGGGGDVPEAVNAGLIRALSGGAGQWRAEASVRRIILFGDAPPKDTALRSQVLSLAANTGVSLPNTLLDSAPISILGDVATTQVNEGLAKTAFAIETLDADGETIAVPVEIFTILIGNNATARNSFENLATSTGGQASAVNNASEIVEAIIQAINFSDDYKIATDEDTSVTILASELFNNNSDIDPENILSIVEINNLFNGTAIINEEGNIEFTPNSNFNGKIKFDYTFTDGIENNTGTVEVIVNPVNYILIANDDTFATDEDVSLTILANELFDNDINLDTEKSLSISSINNLFNGTAIINAEGNIEFTPADEFNGIASFDYTVTDGIDSEIASVEVMVNFIHDAPIANTDTAATDEDTSVTILASELLGNDINVEQLSSLSLLEVNNSANGTAEIDAEGNVVFTPDLNFNGIASFNYVLTDGIENSTGLVQVNVNPVNDTPFITTPIPDLTLNKNSANTIIDFADYFEDIEEGDNLFYEVSSRYSSIRGDVFDFFGFDSTTRALVLDYTETFIGTATITATVIDSEGEFAEDSFDITIVNSPAVAVTDTFTTDENVPLTIVPTQLLENDTDLDTADILEFVGARNPVNGTLRYDEAGNIEFTPVFGFNGVASFEYIITDG
ncbi:hypothetical protein H1P_6640002 [Hyella patelloides LEGE 07179]|uniref:VWFA domain-containing protein n=1 Tax=Hyella patelloides LEGE 07179 TaxID=945734 RepID=A0A563W2Q9_9CYAN|nr:tandem-95 repeat protein [Hyella patelloides]VEP17968.1 hypothetical protein H1P_6640002 [Hyella patelloides LEGE 07179]